MLLTFTGAIVTMEKAATDRKMNEVTSGRRWGRRGQLTREWWVLAKMTADKWWLTVKVRPWVMSPWPWKADEETLTALEGWVYDSVGPSTWPWDAGREREIDTVVHEWFMCGRHCCRSKVTNLGIENWILFLYFKLNNFFN